MSYSGANLIANDRGNKLNHSGYGGLYIAAHISLVCFYFLKYQIVDLERFQIIINLNLIVLSLGLGIAVNWVIVSSGICREYEADYELP